MFPTYMGPYVYKTKHKNSDQKAAHKRTGKELLYHYETESQHFLDRTVVHG